MAHSNIYLRRRIVYIPTLGRRSVATYEMIEPIAVIPAHDTGAIRETIKARLTHGHPQLPPLPPRSEQTDDRLLPKLAGVRSWSAFYNGVAMWSVSQIDGRYEIVPDRRSKGSRGWVPDTPATIAFPDGTDIDSVTLRMAEIIQAAVSAP